MPLTPQGLKGPDAAMFLNILDYALILMRGITGMHESLSNGKKKKRPIFAWFCKQPSCISSLERSSGASVVLIKS